MTSSASPITATRDHRVCFIVAALTLVGLVLRCWNIGRLGLTHFDEGIYALAGTWSLSPEGIGAISPTLIPYAPPGFAILVGIAYALLGSSDFAAISASQFVGTATVPVVAWVGARTFGPGAGCVAAALAACSGPHIAFSRMALTDALFLLAWLVALGVGQRFLEQPGWIRGVILGLLVGMAQQSKYNGWLSGGFVLVAAMVGVLLVPEERRRARWARVFGWGLPGAMVSALIVWPWYRFVDQHGGYDALLRHQRSYLGGFASWSPHLATQFDHSIALSGGWPLVLGQWTLAASALLVQHGEWLPKAARGRILIGGIIFGTILMGVVLVNLPWWLCLAMLPARLGSRASASRLFAVAWVALALLTPFYHPYARLWLPLHALGWIAAGGWFAAWVEHVGVQGRQGNASPHSTRTWPPGRIMAMAWPAAVTLGCAWSHATLAGRTHALSGLLEPSDSLRVVALGLAAKVPEGVMAVKMLARPPVTYYLGGRMRLWPQPGPEAMARSDDPRIWALYDAGVSDSSDDPERLPSFLAKGWEVVAVEPTRLSLPALLDIHPGAARSAADAARLRQAPLWLLRPKRAGGPR